MGDEWVALVLDPHLNRRCTKSKKSLVIGIINSHGLAWAKWTSTIVFCHIREDRASRFYWLLVWNTKQTPLHATSFANHRKWSFTLVCIHFIRSLISVRQWWLMTSIWGYIRGHMRTTSFLLVTHLIEWRVMYGVMSYLVLCFCNVPTHNFFDIAPKRKLHQISIYLVWCFIMQASRVECFYGK